MNILEKYAPKPKQVDSSKKDHAFLYELVSLYKDKSISDVVFEFLKSIRNSIIPYVLFAILFTGMSQGMDILIGFVDQPFYIFLFQTIFFLGGLMLLLAGLNWTLSKYYNYQVDSPDIAAKIKFNQKEIWQIVYHEIRANLSVKSLIKTIKETFHKIFNYNDFNTSEICQAISDLEEDKHTIQRVQFNLKLMKWLQRFFGLQIFVFFCYVSVKVYLIYSNVELSLFLNLLLFLLLELFAALLCYAVSSTTIRFRFLSIQLDKATCLLSIASFLLLGMSIMYPFLGIISRILVLFFLGLNGMLFFLALLELNNAQHKKTNGTFIYQSKLKKIFLLGSLFISIVFLIVSFLPKQWIINNISDYQLIDHLHIIFGFIILVLLTIRFLFADVKLYGLIFALIIISVFLGLNDERNYHALPLKKNPSALIYIDDKIQSTINRFKQDSQGTIPVYALLAQGGGSRAGLWTYSILNYLDTSTKHNFYKHLIFQSGASGGIMGLSLYLNHAYHYQTKPTCKEADAYKIFEKDYLTLPLLHYLGKDLLVGAFPWISKLFGNNNFSKGRAGTTTQLWLKHESEFSCPDVTNILNTALPDVFQDKNIYLPIYPINTTRVENGKTYYQSDYIYKDSFVDSRNILNILSPTNQSLSFLEASINGARFPFINPAGYIPTAGYFVDAGYADNFGAKAFLQFVDIFVRETKKDTLHKYDLHVLVSINESEGKITNNYPNQAILPLNTILEVRSANNFELLNQVKSICQLHNFKYTEIELPYYADADTTEKNEFIFPLAWELSSTTTEQIVNQIQHRKVKPKLDEIAGKIPK